MNSICIIRFMTIWTSAALAHFVLALSLTFVNDRLVRQLYQPVFHFFWLITPENERHIFEFDPLLGLAIFLFGVIVYGLLTAVAWTWLARVLNHSSTRQSSL